jgi:hypothetical protein
MCGMGLESLRYLSLHDLTYLRYFKGHRDRYARQSIHECMLVSNPQYMLSTLNIDMSTTYLPTYPQSGIIGNVTCG